MFGTTELILILVIILIIFGAGKLPQIGEALGKGIKNFKRAHDDKESTKNITPPNTKGELPASQEPQNKNHD